MISKIITIALKLIEGRWVINQTKKAGLLFYLRVLSVLKTGALGVVIVLLAFQFFVFALVGLILLGIYMAPLDTEAKAWILMGLCSFIILVSIGLMAYAFSEKTWLKYSGAGDLIARLD